MADNKITIINQQGVEQVLLDVSGTTATEKDVKQGCVFVKNDGSIATGTLEPSSGGGDWVMTEEANDTGTTAVFEFVGVSTIEFTMPYGGSTYTYKALEGMTWQEFVDSDYNPDYNTSRKVFSISGSEVWYNPGSIFIVKNVVSTDVIVAKTYDLTYTGAGGAD
jgi:hypothetical protein